MISVNGVTTKKYVFVAVSGDSNMEEFPADYDTWALPPVMPVPLAGDHMAVSILSTWNGPSKFIVSEFSTCAEFDLLEEEMNELYSNQGQNVQSPPSPIQIGGLYAGFFSEYHSWYRFIATKEEPLKNRPGEIAVHAKLVDYGERTVLNRRYVQPLYCQFRELPFQAYGASLFGMVPLGGGFEWSDDSKRGLDDLIKDKDLFAIVKLVTVDERCNPPVNLMLELVDTNVEPNVVITWELVARGLARRMGEVSTSVRPPSGL